MTGYYEEIMELWQAGKFFEAICYSCERMTEGLLNQEKTESFSKNALKFWELVETECEENPAVMSNLYEMVKKARHWDDKTLCRELRISDEAVGDIKKRHKPRVGGLGLKMLYELFPQMAV